MSIEQTLYQLKITSAVVVGGVIKKAGEVVELAEREARDLLRREKAIVHTVVESVERMMGEQPAERPEQPTEEAPAEDDAPEQAPDDPAQPARSRSRK